MKPPYSPLSVADVDALTKLNDTTQLFVDVNRTDVYTPNGTRTYPFKSLAVAIASIVGSGPANPFEICLSPGVYQEPVLNVPLYTRIVGSGWTGTRLEALELGQHFINLSPGCVLRELNVLGPTGTGYAAIRCNSSDPRSITINEVSIGRGYYGVLVDPTVSVAPVLIQNMSFGYTGSNLHTLVRATGFANVFVVDTLASGPVDSVGTGFSVAGADALMTLSSVYHECENGVGAFVDEDALLRVVSGVFAHGLVALHVGPTGSPILDAVGLKIHRSATPGYTSDLVIDTATAVITLSGSFSRDRVVNPAVCPVDAAFLNRDPLDKGFTAVGELNVGLCGRPLFPLMSYTQDSSDTGVVSGGDVIRDGGLLLNVSAGTGYINNLDPHYIEWVDTAITLGASEQNEYVFVTSLGVVTHSNVKPDYSENIVLARAVTNATDVVLLTTDDVEIPHSLTRLASYFGKAVGPLVESGVAITAHATPLRISISDGVFWVGLSRREVTGVGPIDLIGWYRDGAGGWTPIPGMTTMNVTQWDDTSGALAALTAGKFTNATVYVASHTGGSEYHIVLGQEEFNNQADAETGDLPTPPDFLKEYACRLSAIIVEQAGAGITSIVDARPRIGQFAAVAGGVAGDHDLLSNLLNDTHSQYLTTGRADTWHGLLAGAHVTNGNTHDHTAGAGAQIDHTGLANRGVNTHVQLDTHLADGTIHTPLTAVAPVNVDKSAAVVGVAVAAARADHKHDAQTGVPVGTGTANAEGTATTLARADHIHAGPVFGRDYQIEEGLARTTHTGDSNFQDKITLTTPALDGIYRVNWQAVCDMGNANQNYEVRLYNTTDSAIVGVTRIDRCRVVTLQLVESGFANVLFTGASKTFVLQFRTTFTGAVIGIQDSAIELWRVS